MTVTSGDCPGSKNEPKLYLRVLLILLLAFSDWTPLHHCAKYCGNVDTCRLLLQSNADVNKASGYR
jgi:hypothetical protein